MSEQPSGAMEWLDHLHGALGGEYGPAMMAEAECAMADVFAGRSVGRWTDWRDRVRSMPPSGNDGGGA